MVRIGKALHGLTKLRESETLASGRWLRIPLQLVLVAPFVLQIFTAVGLVSYFSFRNSQATVDDLANQLMKRTSSLVDQHLDSYLQTAVQASEATTDAIESKLLDPHDLKAMQRFLWHWVRTTNITYISYGLADGSYAGAGHLSYSPQLMISETSARTQGKTFNYIADAQGNPTQLIPDDYSHFEEKWYSETQRTKRPLWTQVYTWNDGSGTVSIAAARPVRNAQGQTIGAVGADLSLTDIGQFLRNLQISPGAGVFILERNGDLIASSSLQSVVKRDGTENQRLNALKSNDPLMQATARHIQKQFGGFGVDQAQQLKLEVDGERQFVHVMPWRDQLGLNWLVVVHLPESDFMAQTNQNARTMLLFSLLALAIATLTGIWTTRKIARPIQQLDSASQAIAADNLDASAAQTPGISSIQELHSLANSFNQMARQIKASFLALEESKADLEERVEARTAELSAALNNLKRTQAQLVQTEKMSSLGQLVAGVAHEINNPINFIHGNLAYAAQYTEELLALLDLYERHCPNPDPEIRAAVAAVDLEFLRQDVAKLHQSMAVGTTRVREIVLSLRNFAHLDEADCKAVSLHAGLDSTLLILDGRFKAKPGRSEIQLIKNYGDLPLIECYASQINQVFMNVIANALDALDEIGSNSTETGKHPNLIQIQTRRQDDWVEVRIRDNGPGMPEQVQASLFDPFFTTKPVGQGTGLGLSISYQIVVQKHGGKLSCVSAPGQGAEFVIELPIQQSAAQPDPTVLGQIAVEELV